MKIWRAHLLKHLIKPFLFFLLSFFIVYVAIDLSMNGAEGIELKKICLHYLGHFTKFFDLFVSTAFLLALLKLLLDFSQNREFLALHMAGLSQKKLLSPLLFFSFSLVAVSYANSQWLTSFNPSASKVESHLSWVSLPDGSELVFQHYDPEKKVLFDLFLVQSANQIAHIQKLDLTRRPAAAHFVTFLARNEEGLFLKTKSEEILFFPELAIAAHTPWEERPLSQLAKIDRIPCAAFLHYKLALPLLSPLMLLFLSPIAFRFSKARSSFLFVALSLLLFIVLRTALDALLILAENQVIAPWAAIWVPLGSAFAIALIFFLRSSA